MMRKADLEKRALALARKADLEKRALALAKNKAEAEGNTVEAGEQYMADIDKLLQEHPGLVNDFEIKEMLRVKTEQMEKLQSQIDGLSPLTRSAREWCNRMGMRMNFGDTPAPKLDVIPEGFDPDAETSWLREFREKLDERAVAVENQAREARQQQRGADPSQRPRWQAQPQQSRWLPKRRGYYWALIERRTPMSHVTDFFRRIFIPPTPEEQKPRFVPGQPVAGSKHYLVEQQQQDTQSWAFPRGKPPGGWLR
jgi:hypothetical protein